MPARPGGGSGSQFAPTIDYGPSVNLNNYAPREGDPSGVVPAGAELPVNFPWCVVLTYSATQLPACFVTCTMQLHTAMDGARFRQGRQRVRRTRHDFTFEGLGCPNRTYFTDVPEGDCKTPDDNSVKSLPACGS